MYYKTRPVASPQSYTRAKEFSSRDISVHPWFVEKMDENEDARLQFFKAIRSFKPSDVSLCDVFQSLLFLFRQFLRLASTPRKASS